MIHRFFRHIKEGFIGVKRHLGISLSSAMAVTLTLLLVGVFIVLSANIVNVSQDIENSISMVALIDYDVTSEVEKNGIKNRISMIDGVTSIEYRSKEEEFNFYNETYPDMAEFSDLYRDDNPFHDVFMINVSDGSLIENIKKQISALDGIDSVEDGGVSTYVMVDILQKVRLGGGVLVIALSALAVYLIFYTIKTTIQSRSDEIIIMRNVGARNGYVRAPFLVEGIILSILGVIIPIVAIIFGYNYLYRETGGILMGVLKLIEPFPFLYYVCGMLFGISVVVGFIGSYISVSRNLRLRR